MAISNQLNVSYNYQKIDELFDFYLITTIEKYIPFGAKCLDFVDCDIKVDSIAFENGKSLYIMTKKDLVSKGTLVRQLNNEKLSIKKISSIEMPNYILFRLFLYSLNNFNNDELSFNNLTGKFYIFKPEWMKKDRSSFIALGINVDATMNLVVEAATFSKLSLFKGIKKTKEYPRYIFADKNNTIRRIFDDNDTPETYIKRGIYNKKAELPFLTIGQEDSKNNKVYHLFYILQLLREKYSKCLQFDFKILNIIRTIAIKKDEPFMERTLKEINELSLLFVDYTGALEYKEEFDSLVQAIKRSGGNGIIGDAIDKTKANIVLIHNQEYYEQRNYLDPYKTFQRRSLLQCITVEDSAEKIINDNEAIINTILKEVVIKNDLLKSKKISLDNWEAYGFECDWIFGKEKEGKHYFIIIHPNGRFDLYNKSDDFSTFDIEILNKCSDYLTDNKGKEKAIIAFNGNINVISRTNRYPLPAKEMFEQPVISRSEESRNKYLSGVVDINFYDEDNETYYSVGIKGYGMNTKIVRAPHLYKVEVVDGKNIMPDILSTLSVAFVKYKAFTVLPYPFKYLNEYILMEGRNKTE